MTDYKNLWRETDRRIDQRLKVKNMHTLAYITGYVLGALFCILYVGFMLLFNGCAGLNPSIVGHVPCDTQTIRILVDDELPHVYDQWTQRAVDYWNAQIGRRVLLYVGRSRIPIEDQEDVIVVRRAPHEMRNKWDLIKRWGSTNSIRESIPTKSNPKPCIVQASVYVRQPGDDVIFSSREVTESGAIWYSDPNKLVKITPALAYLTLIHEFGHVSGLSHSNIKTTLMHKRLDHDNIQTQLRTLGEDVYPALETIYGYDIR